MLSVALGLLLLAEPASVKELKIAAPGLVLTGMDASLAAPLTEQVAKAFAPIRVITPRDISALLGLERQKELLGCGSGECMAELGNALGVQGVLLGDIVKLGGTIQINARIIEPVAGRSLATASERVTDESDLFDALTRLGLTLRGQFYASQGAVAPLAVEATTPRSPGTRRFFLIPLAVSVASLAGSLVCFVVEQGSYASLTSGAPHSLDGTTAMQMANTGSALQAVSAVLLTAGIVALAAAVAVLIFGSSGDSR